MTKTQRALLLGMALGDGCLKKKNRDYVEFCIAHGPKQIEYLEHKLSLMHSIIGGKLPKIHRGTHTLLNGQTYDSYRFSKQHRYFKLLRRWLYDSQGTKRITTKVLDKLTPHAVALWYMDDGSLSVNLNREGNVSSFEVRLYTYCSLSEALDIQKYFWKTYRIHVKVSQYQRKAQYNIKMNTTNGSKFIELVRPFIIPSMRYKVDITSRTRARNPDTNGSR